MNARPRIWNPSMMLLNVASRDLKHFEYYIKPESDLERQIIRDNSWQDGAYWGEPRSGHPEGKVIYHIHEVLQNIDKATKNWTLRQQLRLIAIIHDTFKLKEEQVRPRTDWSKHHAIFALEFAKLHISDQAVLDVIELHDEAYYAWRASFAGHKEKSDSLLDKLKGRIGANMQLYYLFFKCDTQTGDKYQSPVAWFEQMMQKEITISEF
ncbi:hypothetical protein OAK19_02095 [Aureispira]|nr:hypothetical protein [Aureispira sp.]